MSSIRSFRFLLASAVAFLIAWPVAADVDAPAPNAPSLEIRGAVVDASGGVVVGAAVTLRDAASGAERHAITDASGEFVFPHVAVSRYTIVAAADGFAPAADVVDPATRASVRLTLEAAPLNESITVTSRFPDVAVTSTATKLAASPMDVPMAIEAIPQTLLRQQAALSLQDALRNVAGVTPNLGEGRRDQFLIRGFTAATDTLIDGLRDDAQYYRDLATVERVEVLKGPAAALFGRGSSGGVINRVMKKPLFNRPLADVGVMVGGFGTKRVSFDAGHPLFGGRSAYRVAGAWEDSGSFRDFATVSRFSLAPSVSWMSASSSVTGQMEFLHDRRLPDRGIPSVNGRPADVRTSQYYGYPQEDFIRTDVVGGNVRAERHFSSGWMLRNVTRLAAYDTAFSNTMPTDARATPAGITVKRGQYNAVQDQQNFFNQTEAVHATDFLGAMHVLLVGFEGGRQQRSVTRFTGTAPDVALVDPVLTRPVYSTVPSSNNEFVGLVAGIYVQDQISIGEHWKALAGFRGDRYSQTLDDVSPKNVDLARVDRTWSPRVGLVYQPTHQLSLYSSVSRSFQPSGEGLSLAVNTAELKPESTRNVEGGVKVSLAGGRATATASVFRLDRSNIKTTDPLDTTRLVLVGRQRSDGFEFTFDGSLTQTLSMRASYAGLDASILRSNSVLSGVRIEGNQPGLVPRHSFTLWTVMNTTKGLTLGGGITASGDRYAANDDLVMLPGFARADLMAAYRVGAYELSVNVQNLLGARYYESATGNFQIYPAAPRNALVSARYRF